MLFSPVSSWLSLSITRVLPWNGLNHSLLSFCGHWREPAKTYGAVKCGTTRCRSLEMGFLMFNRMKSVTKGVQRMNKWPVRHKMEQNQKAKMHLFVCLCFLGCVKNKLFIVCLLDWIFFFFKNTAWKRFLNSSLSNPDMLQSPWMRQ